MPLLLARQPAGGRRPVAARRPRGWPLAGAGALLLALVVVARTVDVAAYLEAARTWVEPLGALAPGAFVVVYVVATLLGVPGMPFTLLSPFLFGPWPAVAVMIVASGGSAAAAISRATLSWRAWPGPRASPASPRCSRRTTGW